MAKQLNVSLAFSADTSKAKAQLQDLQRQLTNLTNSTGSIANSQGMGITKQLHEASMAAAQLKVQLQDATNVNTGKLDLVKFNQSLKASGMDLQQYKTQLMALGPAGAQAFSGLAAAVTNAEAPMFRLNARVRELGVALANTARWQISSSVLHGFMGAISGAFGYAKDLNESLNNIRIVTGKSTDEMAQFAKDANKAAKALSSTTTQYTDAALIFYQQGLSGKQVQERAETTLKMANVSRQSAETVSQQMTSVWNNFYDGGKSLEYYSDVMVALGAATASSSDEIATGLEKFSAVSNTVGLSYEYAAAALATVTAQTRQSADTVGTAFRTLFTRLEGLNLGETADDGTTLNKYSEALYKVGVNIKDQQGQLKDMDQILDELGAKWKTIGKEQQVALAQTVGGARQYATLIALMDNWDFFQKNLGTAKGAEGSLQEQADIYAESWEAARKEVKASLESIYTELLNDKFFININKGFASFLNIINNIMEGLGGLKGVLLTIGSILLTVYSKQIGNSLKNLTTTLYSWTSNGRKEIEKLRSSAAETLKTMTGANLGNLYKNQAIAQEKYLANVKHMNEEEQKRAKILMEQHGALAQQVIDTAKLIQEQQRNVNGLQYRLDTDAKTAGQYAKHGASLETLMNRSFGFDPNYLKTDSGLAHFKQQLAQMQKAISMPELKNMIGNRAGNIFDSLFNSLDKGNLTTHKAIAGLKTLGTILEDYGIKMDSFETKSNSNVETVKKNREANEALGKAYGQNIASQINLGEATDNLTNAFERNSARLQQWQDKAVLYARNLGSVAMAMTSLISLAKTWNNEDLSFGEKALQTMQSMAFILPTLIALLKAEQILLFANNIALGVQAGILVIWDIAMKNLKKDTIAYNAVAKISNALWTAMDKIIASPILSIGLLAAAFAGLVAIVAIIIKTYKDFQKTTPEGKLQAATRATEAATNAAKEAANAYSELSNSINNIETAAEKIANLTKGTVEWAQAIRESNNQARELIKTYKLLENEDYYYDGTQIVLTENGKQKALKQAYDKATEADQKATIANTGQLRAENIKKANSIYAVGYEQLANGKIESVRFLTNEEKIALAQEISNSGISYTDEAQVKELIQKIIPDKLSDAVLDTLTASISKNSRFEGLISAIEDNTIAINNEIELLARSGLAYSDKFNNLDSAEQNVVADVLAEKTEEKAQLLLDSQDFTISDKERKAYAEEQGFTFENGNYYSVDSEGKKVKEGADFFTDDVIKQDLAYNMANSFVTASYEAGLFDSEIQQEINQKITPETRKEAYKTDASATAERLGFDDAGWAKYQEELSSQLPGLMDLTAEYNELATEAVESVDEWAKKAGKLTEALEDNEDALNSSDIAEREKALKSIAEEASNTIGVKVDSQFVDDNLDKIKEMASGSRDALLELKEAAIIKLTTKLDPEQATIAETETLALFNYLQNLSTIDIHANPQILEEVKVLGQKIVEAFGWTAEEASTFFAKCLNMEVPVETKTVTLQNSQVQKLENGTAYMVDGTQHSLSADQITQLQSFGQVTIPVIGESKLNWDKAQFKGFATQSPIFSNSKSNNKGSKKSKKKASDEIERYHVIKEQLEDIEQELDRISKAKDRAFGGDKLKLMDDEIAKTQELLDKEQEYFDQINANYGPDRKALEAYGAKFDANGALLNYDSIMNAQINAFNSSLSDEAEENYNNFKELIDQYEETDDLLAEQRQKLIDLQNEIFDLMLEKLEYEVTLKIDVNEDANKYLDFLMEMNGDGMDHALDNIDILGEKIADGMENIETYTKGLNNMFKNRGYKGNVVEDLQSGKVTPEELAEMYDLTEAEVDLMREYMGNIMDTTKEIQNMRKEITDQLINAMEEINEKFDEQIDKINRAAEGMQHYRDIIDLVGQDVLGISDEMMKTFGEKQLNNSIANVKASRTKMLENEREYNAAVAELERLKSSGASEFAIEEQERVVKAAQENLASSTDEFQNAWQETLEQTRQLFDDTIKSITDNFENAMSGIYGNLEALQDAYDRQSEINERYLEDYEKIYELSKLNRDIGNSIDNTDSIKAKQALLELQEEINALEESGAEISKYDLDFLRQKYELRLAEIALEEAQNAKSQVRMTRDSEGNWNYTYTANEENISKAEQNYEDALYKTQQLTTDYIKDLENRIFQLNTDLVNALSNVDPNDAEGRQRIYDYYMGQNNYLTSQLNTALGNNANLYNQDWMNYSNATGYKISDNEKWMDSFNETTLSMLTGYSSLGDYQNAFRDSSLLMYNSINDAASEFATNTEMVMNAAGTSIETFAEDAEQAFENFTISTKEATDSIDGIDEEAKETFDSILTKLMEFNKAYDEQIQQTIQANKDLIQSFNDLIKKESELDESRKQKQQEKKTSSSGSSSSSSGGDGVLNVGDSVTFNGGNYYSSSNGGTSGSRGPGRKVTVTQIKDGALYPIHVTSSDSAYGWLTRGQLSGYDTGGYTGAWGTTAGKLAMLHEKELVLNKQDTENILQSVNLVRQISDWISGRVNAMQYGSMLSAFGLPGDNRNVLEQMVTIHAEFPNANNRAEIEAAFDNLVNRAAQYAYRK